MLHRSNISHAPPFARPFARPFACSPFRPCGYTPPLRAPSLPLSPHGCRGHRFFPPSGYAVSSGPKKADKAPSKLKATILVCSQNPESNSCRLLRSSLWAWFLVVTAIEHQPDITTLFDRLSHSDIEISADKLDNLTVHESLFQLFEHTFYKSQRARDRQSEYVTWLTDLQLTRQIPSLQPALNLRSPAISGYPSDPASTSSNNPSNAVPASLPSPIARK
ncbi:hypothetical protein B0J13DRAFT_293071 [Dactylonectria estremocensis]|uniref:Uncharacterized protein n=1 Tax=Dactylonectria estremocensis TaxID=1079267 RepID=A0A9P9D075_9HYPO|nr:hypothetical protein B0J13DRAFT_293071 [Dactylonectria estremocensis]